MTDTLKAQITAAEAIRCAAMLAGDPAALEAVLDSRLQFHHSNGNVDDRAAFVAKIKAGRIKYAGIKWEEERVEALGADVALLTGKMITDVKVEGTDKRLLNRVLTVWSKTGGSWLMIAFQSTPLSA
jgi:ketosteroid isomerase-like protein